MEEERKRAYNRADAAKILGMHRKSISRNIDKGIFPPLTGATKGGVPTFRYKSYYSEDDIKEIRNIQATGIWEDHARMDLLQIIKLLLP